MSFSALDYSCLDDMVYPCVPVSLHDTIAEEFDFLLAHFNLGDEMTVVVQRAEKKSLILTINLH